jgi:hypothetical protein
LKEKVAARNGYSTGFGELTPDSPFSQLVEIWLEDLDLEGELAESTGALYERNMRQLVMLAFENLLLREISVRKVDQFIKRLASTKSYSTAKQARTVLSLALGLAVRYDALRENPVRDTARLHKPPRRPWRSRSTRPTFGHEFRAFTGLTPTRYVEVRRQFLREHRGHVLDSWPLPAD